MSLIYTAREVMNYVRNLPQMVTKIYEEFTGIDTRVTSLEGGILVTTDRFAHIRIPADVNANDVWERAIFRVPAAAIIKDVVVIPDTSIGQATNYMTLDCQNKDTSGTATTSLGSRAVNSTNTLGAMVGADLITTNANVTVGQTLSLKKTVASAGQAFPGGLVQVRYSYS